mmetsp:Transcript_7084/g.14308  ORF Transcript_7084/g.14308 Transcript_7084/m.14308 type:complete len:81 (-) Transcript_7084:1357-1599(-)
MARRIVAHEFDNTFYMKVSALGFMFGAGIETFMVKTGFYDIVTRVETQRRLEFVENQKEWEAKGGQVPINWPGQEPQSAK